MEGVCHLQGPQSLSFPFLVPALYAWPSRATELVNAHLAPVKVGRRAGGILPPGPPPLCLQCLHLRSSWPFPHFAEVTCVQGFEPFMAIGLNSLLLAQGQALVTSGNKF